MANRETRTLSFTPEQSAFVANCVESGRYQSASEVVRTALRLLEDQEEARLAERKRVRLLVREGVDQIDRGEVVEAGSVFLRLARKHRKAGGGKRKK